MKILRAWVSAVLVAITCGSAARASLLDSSFNIGSGADGIVEQVLPLSDGRILICGNFTSFNGQPKAYIARLNADGSVDQSFTGQASYWVRNMAVQADGKIVVGGFFKNVGPAPRSLIARLNPDGSNDATFNPGSGATDSLGTAIDGNADPFVFWVAVQPDGKILATGNFRNYNGASSSGIVRINPDGSRDASFNVGGGLDSWGRHIRIQPNGQIVLAGWFNNYNGKGANRLVKINPDGSPDWSFNPYFGDRTAIYSTVDAGGGKILASGHSLNYEGLFWKEMRRLNPDGSEDTSFVGFTNEKTQSLAVQPDGKIIVGGYFTYVNGQPRTSIARMNPDGTLDDSFSAQINNYVWSVALQGDGKLLISGGFYTVDGQPRSRVARLLTGVSGNPPPPPPPTTPAPVLSATANSDSQITLTWSDSATDRSGYSVERKVGAGGTYATVATLAGSVRSYLSSGLAAGTQYYFRLRATAGSGVVAYSNEASDTTSSAPPPPPPTGSSSAVFVARDRTTHGSWKGVYGGAGYAVIGDQVSYPSGVQVTPAGHSAWTWNDSTSDVDALQKVNSSTDRLAACWYSAGAWTIDFRITDGSQRRVAIYCLDWDAAGRFQSLEILDGDTGARLDSQTIADFAGGIYVVWDIKGHVKLKITPSNVNGVVSGIFFGGSSGTAVVATPTFSPQGGRFTTAQSVSMATATAGAEIRYTMDGSEPSSTSTLYTGSITISSTATIKARGFKSGMTPSATASATYTIGTASSGTAAVFVARDTTTRGNWRNVYGAEGYNVIGSSASYPAYATVSAQGKSDWTWNSATTDSRALQTPNGLSRVSACWYAAGSFTVDVAFSGSTTHRLAVYVCDWDFGGRTQTVDLIDADTGAVLNSQSVSAFTGGQYLVWDVKGRVKLRFTKVAGMNAVVNGIFFGPAGTQL